MRTQEKPRDCTNDPTCGVLKFCSLHAAAPELLEDLKLACEILRTKGEEGIALKCEQSIARAEGTSSAGADLKGLSLPEADLKGRQGG